MTPSPYKKFSADEITLRDRLAIDRTVLANQRTLLAYARTSIGLLAAGITFIQFLDSVYATVIGFIAVICSVVVAYFGVKSYARGRRHFRILFEAEQE